MNSTSHLFFLIFTMATLASYADEPQPRRQPSAASEKRLLAYEATGLCLLRPYERGKVPVLFIHGLWSTPCSWDGMIHSLEDDPALAKRYQFWTFGYSTGDPIPYSAHLLRNALDDLRRQLDPDKSDRTFERLVVVGHSMGGLLAKLLVVEPGDRLWQCISDRPFADLHGDGSDRELFRSGLMFSARPDVARVVFIATPHRGSPVDRGAVGRIGARLVRKSCPLQAAHDRLVAQNPPDYFRDFFRRALPTSIDELEEGNAILNALVELPVRASKAHSIIAVRGEPRPGEGSDGLVRYTSAHIDPVASELIVSSGHLCQDHPRVIAEVQRILDEDRARQVEGTSTPAAGPCNDP
jgi:pimeloyl-ACP methyl ester carboxylesterase